MEQKDPSERIINRITKLLETSSARGADPAEAEVAAAMASRLMLKYNIDESLARARDPRPSVEEFARVTVKITHSAVWQKELLSYLVYTHDCMSQTVGKWEYQVIGGKYPVQTVVALFEWLVRELGRLASSAYRAQRPANDLGRGHMDPMRFHTSFKRGAISSIANRLYEQKRRVEDEARGTEGGEFALVQVGSQKDRALVHFYPELRRYYLPTPEEKALDEARAIAWREEREKNPPKATRVYRERKPKPISINADAFRSGQVAGSVVRLSTNPEIA